jgi:hypothetical protein
MGAVRTPLILLRRKTRFAIPISASIHTRMGRVLCKCTFLFFVVRGWAFIHLKHFDPRAPVATRLVAVGSVVEDHAGSLRITRGGRAVRLRAEVPVDFERGGARYRRGRGAVGSFDKARAKGIDERRECRRVGLRVTAAERAGRSRE